MNQDSPSDFSWLSCSGTYAKTSPVCQIMAASASFRGFDPPVYVCLGRRVLLVGYPVFQKTAGGGLQEQ